MTADDDLLMDRLRGIAAEVDGPPELVREHALAAFGTRHLDDELARLVLDSAESAHSVRGGEVRLLSYETDTVQVELQVQETGDTLTLRGMVVGGSGEVVVETPARRRTARVDPDGWFTVAGLRPGLHRIRVQPADAPTTTTGWITL
ncbi:hypothetical protein [Actinokineospora sp.]|uniref:hypothetical protein n=1 Tax=Actinokineospora sp. TaxID=1872133 RepID=UPI0040381FE6